MNKTPKKVLLILPMAFQDGIEKYNGIIEFVRRTALAWDMRLDRMSKSSDCLDTYKLSDFDGAIVDDPPSPRVATALSRLRIPLVAIDWRNRTPLHSRRRCVRVESNSTMIGQLAAHVLQETEKYESFAYLPVAGTAEWSDRRGTAFAKDLGKSGIAVKVLNRKAPLLPQLRALPKPTALFAANDITATRFLYFAKSSGINVPEDVSVLGVDNDRLTCLHADPPLASIQPDFEEAGILAAEALNALMSGGRTPKLRTYRVKTVALRKSMAVSGPSGRLVLRAKELIRDTPTAEFRGITELANQLGISRRLLDKRFRQIDGRSVLEAVQDRRLEEVCNLLRNSNLSILDICETCFPKSGSYPMRLFKRRFGMTMRTYRKTTNIQSVIMKSNT